MQKLAGAGTRIFTRRSSRHTKRAYWTTRTSVGIIFGSGLLISFVVGIMIVYQIVSTQVEPAIAAIRHIESDRLSRPLAGRTVTAMSLLIVIAGFIPALAAALGLYSVIRQETLLPVMMSEMRACRGLRGGVGMAVISALLSVWRSAARRSRRRILRGSGSVDRAPSAA